MGDIVQEFIVDGINADTEPAEFSLSESSRRPGTCALLNHFKPVEASSDSEIEENHILGQQEPEVLEISSGLPSPSSTATENGSLPRSVNSNTTNSARTATIADSVRTQRRKQKPRKAKNEGDEPSTHSRKWRRKR